MKKFSAFLTEAIQSSDVHSDLKKIGEHKDNGGGYHLYKGNGHSVDKIIGTLKKHGFTRINHYRSGGAVAADVHMYERTPARYHTESVSIDHEGGKATWIRRSIQRG